MSSSACDTRSRFLVHRLTKHVGAQTVLTPKCPVLSYVHLGHFSTYRATRVESAAESGLKVWLSPKGHFGGGSRSMAGERNSPNLEVPECPYYFNFILNK